MKPTKHYRYLQAFQSKRLERDYSHFRNDPQYVLLADFFLTDLYGTQDFSARDAQAKRLHHFTNLAPGMSVHDIQIALDVLELTETLDKQVADILVKMNADVPFSEATYEEAYYRADAYQPRIRQIELIDESLRRVYRLSRISLLGTTLNNTKTMAKLIGMSDMHRFLHKGYLALQKVNDIDPFLDEVVSKELHRLNRIYKVTT